MKNPYNSFIKKIVNKIARVVINGRAFATLNMKDAMNVRVSLRKYVSYISFTCFLIHVFTKYKDSNN